MPRRAAPAVIAALAFAATAMPVRASAGELATAHGTIAFAAASSARCAGVVVEARAALDAHLIAVVRPAVDAAGVCRYEMTVPAQTAVWLSVHDAGVLAPVNAARLEPATFRAGPGRPARASVALRFTVVAASTYFFAPGEDRELAPLAYGATTASAPA